MVSDRFVIPPTPRPPVCGVLLQQPELTETDMVKVEVRDTAVAVRDARKLTTNLTNQGSKHHHPTALAMEEVRILKLKPQAALPRPPKGCSGPPHLPFTVPLWVPIRETQQLPGIPRRLCSLWLQPSEHL